MFPAEIRHLTLHMLEPEQNERTLPPYAPWLIAIGAIAVLTAAFLFATKEPPSASGKVAKVFAMQPPGSERVLVGVELEIKNETGDELLVRGVNVKVKAGDQEFADDTAAAREHQRYFDAFPDFKQSQAAPLAFETKIPPRGQISGLAIVSYPIPKDVFDKRTSTQVTVSLYGRKPLTIVQ
jgi:hypothetical protein